MAAAEQLGEQPLEARIDVGKRLAEARTSLTIDFSDRTLKYFQRLVKVF